MEKSLSVAMTTRVTLATCSGTEFPTLALTHVIVADVGSFMSHGLLELMLLLLM